MQFVVLRDVTGSVQITVVKNEKPQLAEIVSKLTTHSFIDVEGECVNAPQVKLGGLEILPTKIVVQSVADMIPIAEDSSPDIRMDYRWIDLRSEKNVLIFQIGTAFEKHCVDWFVKNDFIGIHTPKITAISSEGGSEVFEIKNYFGQKAYLTQSPQLYKQMSMCAGFDRTFEIADCFRADPSFTSRHATEFTAIDVEMAHIESHHDVMDCQEELIRYALKMVQQEYGQRYKQVFEKDMITISDNKFPRIPLLEVYEILEKQKGYTVPRALKGDLDPEGERLIAEYVKEKYNSDFVFVIDFPAKN
ncbi:aspartyl-trna synthetase [Holotrichia oblita]|nr:aspartyl-trna synthetase [Holotrichia oblita]